MDNFLNNLMYQVGDHGNSRMAAPSGTVSSMRQESLLDEAADDWGQGGNDLGVPNQNSFGTNYAAGYRPLPSQPMQSQAFSSGQMLQPKSVQPGPAALTPNALNNSVQAPFQSHISAELQSQHPVSPAYAEVDMEAIKNALSEELTRQGSTFEAFTRKFSDDSQKNLADTHQHVHRENVKCYRNTQAVIIENTNVLRQLIDERQASLKSMLLGAIVLGILNLGISALLMLHLIFGIL